MQGWLDNVKMTDGHTLIEIEEEIKRLHRREKKNLLQVTPLPQKLERRGEKKKILL